MYVPPPFASQLSSFRQLPAFHRQCMSINSLSTFYVPINVLGTEDSDRSAMVCSGTWQAGIMSDHIPLASASSRMFLYGGGPLETRTGHVYLQTTGVQAQLQRTKNSQDQKDSLQLHSAHGAWGWWRWQWANTVNGFTKEPERGLDRKPQPACTELSARPFRGRRKGSSRARRRVAPDGGGMGAMGRRRADLLFQ